MAVLGRRLSAPQLAAVSLISNRFAAEAVAPALDVSDGRRREMHRAAQGGRIAVAFEEIAPRRGRLRRIVIDPHHEFRVSRLQRRVDQVPGEYCGIAAPAET